MAIAPRRCIEHEVVQEGLANFPLGNQPNETPNEFYLLSSQLHHPRSVYSKQPYERRKWASRVLPPVILSVSANSTHYPRPSSSQFKCSIKLLAAYILSGSPPLYTLNPLAVCLVVIPHSQPRNYFDLQTAASPGYYTRLAAAGLLHVSCTRSAFWETP